MESGEFRVESGAWRERNGNLFLEGEDGEGGEAEIDFQELVDISDDDLAVDELKTIQWGDLSHRVFDMEEFEFDGLVNSTGYPRLIF